MGLRSSPAVAGLPNLLSLFEVSSKLARLPYIDSEGATYYSFLGVERSILLCLFKPLKEEFR